MEIAFDLFNGLASEAEKRPFVCDHVKTTCVKASTLVFSKKGMTNVAFNLAALLTSLATAQKRTMTVGLLGPRDIGKTHFANALASTVCKKASIERAKTAYKETGHVWTLWRSTHAPSMLLVDQALYKSRRLSDPIPSNLSENIIVCSEHMRESRQKQADIIVDMARPLFPANLVLTEARALSVYFNPKKVNQRFMPRNKRFSRYAIA